MTTKLYRIFSITPHRTMINVCQTFNRQVTSVIFNANMFCTAM